MSNNLETEQSTAHANTQTQVISVQGLTKAQILKLKKEVSYQISQNSQSSQSTEMSSNSRVEQASKSGNRNITHKILTLGNELIDQVYTSICEMLNSVDEDIHTKSESQNSGKMEKVQSFKRKVSQIRKNLGNLQKYSEYGNNNFVGNKGKFGSRPKHQVNSKQLQYKNTWVNSKMVSKQNSRKGNEVYEYKCWICYKVGHFARDCKEQMPVSGVVGNPTMSQNLNTPCGENPFVTPTQCFNPYVIYTNTESIGNQSQQYYLPPVQSNFYLA